jgi:hypothetical protein
MAQKQEGVAPCYELAVWHHCMDEDGDQESRDTGSVRDRDILVRIRIRIRTSD